MRHGAPAEAPDADAVVTATRGLAVSVLTADCAPILLADASAGVVAAVHAGWKGAKAGVVESALSRRWRASAPAHPAISAAIGPAISQAAYEVGPEFKAAFVAGAPENEKYFSHAGRRPPAFRPAGLCRRPARGAGRRHNSGALAFAPMKTNRFSSVTGGPATARSPITGAKFPPLCSDDVDNWAGIRPILTIF